MITLGNITVPVQLSEGSFRVPVCSKRVWRALKRCETDEDYIKAGRMLIDSVQLELYDCRLLVSVYIQALEKIREVAGLEIPYYKYQPSGKEVKYTIYTEFDKLAADYANMSLYEIDDIPIIDYWIIVRDAFIYKLSMSEKGREYLNNAYRLTLTEADDNISIGRGN